MKALKTLLMMGLGIIILPFILWRTPKDVSRLAYLDRYFGNSTTGIRGDYKWYPKWATAQGGFIAKYPRYYWLAIRNPAFNYRYEVIGAHGTLLKIERKGRPHQLGSYRVKALVQQSDGKLAEVRFTYGVYKYPFIDRYFRYAFGHKLWEREAVGDKVDLIYGMSVLPFIEKDTAGV